MAHQSAGQKWLYGIARLRRNPKVLSLYIGGRVVSKNIKTSPAKRKLLDLLKDPDIEQAIINILIKAVNMNPSLRISLGICGHDPGRKP